LLHRLREPIRDVAPERGQVVWDVHLVRVRVRVVPGVKIGFPGSLIILNLHLILGWEGVSKG